MKPSDILTRTPIVPRWIVHDMLPRGTMIILAGEAGAGKSTLCYSLAYALSTGAPFLGHPTVPTKVLYFDEENGDPDFLQYNQWAWAGHACPELPHLDTMLRLEHHTLAGGWKHPMRQAIVEHQPGLVIIDTATPAFHIQDENDNSEATRIIQTLRQFQLLADQPTFLILKHEKHTGHEKDAKRTIRGAKAWLGAFDQVLYHVIAKGGQRRGDGTRLTRLVPDKLRAFAMREGVKIDPAWTDTEPRGLLLHALPDLPPAPPKKPSK